jgi:uncharacterized membrane protein YfcA
MKLITLIASFVAGVCAAMGLGGGSILILYLTLIENIDRIITGGVNLMFFLPVGAVSVGISLKNKLFSYKEIIPIIISGIVFSALGTYLAFWLKSKVVSVTFGIFLLVLGVLEVIKVIKMRGNK